MKILTIYYSYTGKCKAAAEDISKKRNTALYEVKDKKKPSVIAAYTIGCLKALLGKNSAIEPITEDLSTYDRIIIVCPVWASRAVPAANTIIDSLPSNKKVEVFMISMSGKSKSKEQVTAKIKSRQSTLVRFKDLKVKELFPTHK